MKRVIALCISMLLLCGLCSIGIQASAQPVPQATVTIVNGADGLVLVQQKVTLADQDEDGAISINDVLYAAHEAKYEGGAAAGYKSELTGYGISLVRLWGVENGGAYGYCVNNTMAMSLSDTVKEGDRITAYVYADPVTYSDAYCYFDVENAILKQGESLTLTLTKTGYDENWATVLLPVVGAELTIDGVKTGVKTDSNGKATLTLDKAGSLLISAKGESEFLVAPACVADVEAEAAFPVGLVIGIAAVAVLAIGGVVSFVLIKKKHGNEA